MMSILTVRLEAELKAKLERAASDDGRTLSNLVVKVLREYLAKTNRGRRS
jgi:predicted transcriptional regulator